MCDGTHAYCILLKSGRNLTGHIQLSSLEPLDLASAQVTVLHGVERSAPAEPVARHSGPEALTVGDGQLPQRRAARHPL